jgi:hypothetical protein
MPVILVLRRQRSGGSCFKANLGKLFRETPISKNPYKNRAGGAQGEGPEFKPQYHKEKKKKKKTLGV